MIEQEKDVSYENRLPSKTIDLDQKKISFYVLIIFFFY